MDKLQETKFQEITAGVYLDRFEELEDGTTEAILLLDDGEDDYSGEIALPAKFIPTDVNEGDYLTLKLSRDDAKTNSALEEARKLLQESED